jgi:cytochrome c553
MKINLPLSLFLVFFMSATTYAADFDALITDCNDCHGKDGISTDDDIPIIAGQSYVVLEDALIAFADEDKPCKESEYRHGDTTREVVTMCEIAGKLSDDDIAALSDHYAGLPFIMTRQPFDQALVGRGATVHERNCEWQDNPLIRHWLAVAQRCMNVTAKSATVKVAVWLTTMQAFWLANGHPTYVRP